MNNQIEVQQQEYNHNEVVIKHLTNGIGWILLTIFICWLITNIGSIKD